MIWILGVAIALVALWIALYNRLVRLRNGCESAWSYIDARAEAFADLYTEPPSWYHSRRGGSFRPRRFVADVGRSLRTTGETLQSRPRGSGSSGLGGGGFGGGGGGSW